MRNQTPTVATTWHDLNTGIVTDSPLSKTPPGDAYIGRRRGRIATLSLLVLFGVLPLFVGDFQVGLATQVLILGLLAASLAHLMGTAGIPSLGHAAFFAIGGYAAGLMSIHVTPNSLVGLAVAFVVSSAAATLSGAVAVRSRGIYLLMLTLAIGEITRVLASDRAGITGGDQGLVGIPTTQLPGLGPIGAPAFIFWYVLAITVVSTWLLLRIDHSAFGLSLRGIRDNESRMRALGYRPGMHRLAAFTVAGGIAGVAGALSVAQEGFISPNASSFGMSALAVIAVVIGGMRSIGGAFIGAVVVVLVRDLLSHYIAGSGYMLLGIVLIIFVYLFPDGVASMRPRVRRRRRELPEREARAL